MFGGLYGFCCHLFDLVWFRLVRLVCFDWVGLVWFGMGFLFLGGNSQNCFHFCLGLCNFETTTGRISCNSQHSVYLLSKGLGFLYVEVDNSSLSPNTEFQSNWCTLLHLWADLNIFDQYYKCYSNILRKPVLQKPVWILNPFLTFLGLFFHDF